MQIVYCSIDKHTDAIVTILQRESSWASDRYNNYYTVYMNW